MGGRSFHHISGKQCKAVTKVWKKKLKLNVTAVNKTDLINTTVDKVCG